MGATCGQEQYLTIFSKRIISLSWGGGVGGGGVHDVAHSLYTCVYITVIVSRGTMFTDWCFWFVCLDYSECFVADLCIILTSLQIDTEGWCFNTTFRRWYPISNFSVSYFIGVYEYSEPCEYLVMTNYICCTLMYVYDMYWGTSFH